MQTQSCTFGQFVESLKCFENLFQTTLNFMLNVIVRLGIKGRNNVATVYVYMLRNIDVIVFAQRLMVGGTREFLL